MIAQGLTTLFIKDPGIEWFDFVGEKFNQILVPWVSEKLAFHFPLIEEMSAKGDFLQVRLVRICGDNLFDGIPFMGSSMLPEPY